MSNHINIRRQSRSGFSLIEVMIALSVLVGALLVTVGNMVNVTNLQKQNAELTSMSRVQQSVTDRINATDPLDLGTVDAPWSIARYENGAGYSPAITSSPPMTSADLVSMGVAPAGFNLKDLKVYFEYWRMIDFTDPDTGVIQPGVLNDSQLTAQAFKTFMYKDASKPAEGLKDGFHPMNTSTNNSPFSVRKAVDVTHPLLIRVIATWDEDATGPRQRREIFTARSP